MPDTGMPPAVPPRPVSHTSTQQWQSFEVRMRRRRVERCLLRAEIALEAGFPDDARAAVEEARRLDPYAPQLAELDAKLTANAAAAPAAPFPWKPLAAAIAFVAVIAAGGAAWSLWPEPAPAATPRTHPRDVVLSAGSAVDDFSVQVKSDRVEVGTIGQLLMEPERVDRTALGPREPEPEPVGLAPAPAVVRASERAMPPPAQLEPLPNPPAPAATAPAVPETPLDAAALPVNAPPPSAAAVVDERARVRAVLARYEAAYTSLDAAAAKDVWPGVDGGALARAFGSLQSQRVSLGRCDVTVSGGSARANCAGSASWKPKVGSGRTEARRWDFTLQNAGGTWRILNAQAK